MPAALHADFVELAMRNSLVDPGATTMLGSSVDLSAVDVPSYVVAGIADHISPWQACYRTTQLLGGPTKFVLSSSGHVASMVNPPTNAKASYLTGSTNPPDAQDWLDAATTEQGSWWPDYVGWLAAHGGPAKKAPSHLGGAGHQPMDPAPGTYVLDA
jgi:polyhydroxyalkanoate synthase